MVALMLKFSSCGYNYLQNYYVLTYLLNVNSLRSRIGCKRALFERFVVCWCLKVASHPFFLIFNFAWPWAMLIRPRGAGLKQDIRGINARWCGQGVGVTWWRMKVNKLLHKSILLKKSIAYAQVRNLEDCEFQAQEKGCCTRGPQNEWLAVYFWTQLWALRYTSTPKLIV